MTIFAIAVALLVGVALGFKIHEWISADVMAHYDQLVREMHAIDLLLGNRRAFDGLETRQEKIAHAIATAKRAEP